MAEENWKLYVLQDPRTQEVRYAGITSKKLAIRLAQHICMRAGSLAKHKDAWIRQLKVQGFRPISRLILDGLSMQEAVHFEISLIKTYRNCGARLTNISDGGSNGMSGVKHSLETRRKISENARPWNKGLKMLEEIRRRMSIAHWGQRNPNRGYSRYDRNQILNLRKSGLTQWTIARIVGSNQSTISDILKSEGFRLNETNYA